MSAALRLVMWSDVQCVWCYLGDARLKRAVEAFAGKVEIVHRSFELHPGCPVDFDAQTYLRDNRGLDKTTQDSLFHAMQERAAKEGLEYAADRIKPTNSHLAMESLHYAQGKGLRQQLSDRLYKGYFVEGHHIGTIDSLAALAGEVGIADAEIRSALRDGTYRNAVDADTAAAHALGAGGVPFMVINERYTVPGALAASELTRIFTQLSDAG